MVSVGFSSAFVSWKNRDNKSLNKPFAYICDHFQTHTSPKHNKNKPSHNHRDINKKIIHNKANGEHTRILYYNTVKNTHIQWVIYLQKCAEGLLDFTTQHTHKLLQLAHNHKAQQLVDSLFYFNTEMVSEDDYTLRTHFIYKRLNLPRRPNTLTEAKHSLYTYPHA